MKNRIRSFKYAFRGIRMVASSEMNFKIHLVAAFLVVCAGVYFSITLMEWIMATICIGMVMGFEALNTAVEVLCDKVEPNHDPMIGKAKDVAAAAVLIVSIVALIVGVLIFGPYIIACM